MEEKIHFTYILNVFKKRWKLIISSIIIVPLLVSMFSFLFIKPVYEAETVLIVNLTSDNNQPSISNIETSRLLVDTYTLLVKSPRVLKKVENKVQGTNYEQLHEKIHVMKEHESQIFTIKVEANDPNEAALLANIVAETLIEELQIIFNSNSTKVLTAANADGHGHSSPVKPNISLIAIVTFILTIFGAFSIAILLESLNNKYHSLYELSKDLNLPIIGDVRGHHQYRHVEIESEEVDK
jgi:capsular polysaccharide biosynthesis protein